MYLFDTNHCVALLNNNFDLVERVVRMGYRPIVTCSIVAGELRYMAQRSERPQTTGTLVDDLLRVLSVFPITNATASEYARVKAAILDRFGPKDRARRRRFDLGTLGITDADLWIAACAAEHDLVVVSSDGDFRRIAEATGIATESWLARDRER